MVGFLLVVDEDTKGDFMAREKETKNRILEGVKKKKRKPAKQPKKKSIKGLAKRVQSWQEKKKIFFHSKREVSSVKHWQECQGGAST